MIGDMRALGVAYGLLLGLLLGSPLIAPDLPPGLMQGLFLLSGFHLRLADRRLAPRTGDWFSHVRMNPGRLLRWPALAASAAIAGHSEAVPAILLAAALCEGLIYPLGGLAMAAARRGATALVLLLLMMATALSQDQAATLVLSFAVGVAGCLVWLRGPDGDLRSLVIAAGGAAIAGTAALLAPQFDGVSAPAGFLCAALCLAHASMLRRRLTPWRLDGGAASWVRRPPWRRPQGLR